MIIEILISGIIILAAVYILYRSVKRKAQGKCDCGSCSSHCPNYVDKNNNMNNNNK